jgi:dihydrofolate reductase
MRKLVSFMHVSLDGFVTDPKGSMDWIKVDNEMFELSGQQTERSDTALYARKTYQMMEAYWPTAADQPDASKHDKEHSAWYKKVEKVVLSKTMKGQKLPNTSILSENVIEEIIKLKQKPGKDIVMFGSPSAVHLLSSENLIDDYFVMINPILIGPGIPLFKGIKHRTGLTLVSNQLYKSGVVCLHYQKLND